MNENLEGKVKERTTLIESLLNKMKKYLSPQLYESILGGQRDGQISHERKKLSIFFSDIRDFTATTDSMEAEALSGLLNTYLDEMAKIALKWGGTIDKFVGDAIMVFFGDPEFIDDKAHAIRAVKMAIEMQAKLNELRDIWKEQGVTLVLHVRMGINTGYCTVGNFGSENRMDYTIIGTQVNLAQRLEAAAPPDGILISNETYALVQDEIACRYNDEIRVKGIHNAVKTYLLLGLRDQKEMIRQYLRKTEDGIALRNMEIKQTGTDDFQKKQMLKALKMAEKYLLEKTVTVPETESRESIEKDDAS